MSAQTPSTDDVVSPAELGDGFGQDERSLAKLPFTVLGRRDARRGSKAIRTEWQGRDGKGKPITLFKEVTWNAKHGLPDFPAEEVYIGLLYYLVRAGLGERTIRVVPYRLLKLMKWGTDGRAYARLRRSLNQLMGVQIETNALWDEPSRDYVEAGIGIIDDWVIRKGSSAPLFGQDDGDGHTLEVSWNERVFEHFRRGRLKVLNVDEFYSLSSPIAKRLYRLVDEALYQTGRAEFDVLHLAHTRLEMSRSYKYPSSVMQSLRPALEELEAKHICRWTMLDSKTPSKKKIVFTSYPTPLKSAKEAARGAQSTIPPNPVSQEDHELNRDLAALSASARAELEAEALDLLDSYNRKAFAERGDHAIGAAQLLRSKMREVLSARNEAKSKAS
jgi:hypothetical protein